MNTSTETGLEIAVIGMNGRFPGAPTLNDFWNNLSNGEESISFFNDNELREYGISEDYIQHPDYVKAKPSLKDIEYFDAAFFGYTPHEASVLDIQMRMFHEVVYHSLEDAGYDIERYNGLIGLYAGSSTDIHWLSYLLSRKHQSILDSFETGILAYKDLLSQLISYKLNLKGPSHTLYTSCSTSLSAIHLACRGLLLGECNIAVAGGITINLPKKVGYFYEKGMIHSKDGHCRAFSEEANGTIFGDGAGAVVLKRLSDAKRDNDHIYAIVKGSSSNNDGNRKVGFTAPSVEGQAEVLASAYSFAKVNPDTVSYIEAHATGTNIGDPIEVAALKKVFGTANQEACALGSVKANIGHLHAASGVAGFIKTVLSIYHRRLLPQINCSVINKKMELKSSPFYINTQFTEWKSINGNPLRAGISSFGIGGMNVHVIAEEYSPENKEKEKNKNTSDHTLIFSARTKEALTKTLRNYVNFFTDNPKIDLFRVAYTLQLGRRKMRYKKAFVVRDVEDFLIQVDKASNTLYSYKKSNTDHSISFVFINQHRIATNVVASLYRNEEIFRGMVDKSIGYFNDSAYSSIKSYLLGTSQRNDSDPLYHIAEFIVQYALGYLWISNGVIPKTMIAQGIGEYVAAVLSGIIELEDCLYILEKCAISKGNNSVEDNKGYSCQNSLSSGKDQIVVRKGTIPIFSLAKNTVLSSDYYSDLGCRTSFFRKADNAWDIINSLPIGKDTIYLTICAHPILLENTSCSNTKEGLRVDDGMPFQTDKEYRRNIKNVVAGYYDEGVPIRWESLYQKKHYQRIPLPLYPFEKNKIWDPEINKTRSLQTGFGNSEKLDSENNVNTSSRDTIVSSANYKERVSLSSDYKEAGSDTEKVLISILEDLFGIKPIGVNDDFFELGGHSLLITQAVSRIRDVFQIDIPLDTVFERPTIKSVVAFLKDEWGDSETLEEIAKAFSEYQTM